MKDYKYENKRIKEIDKLLAEARYALRVLSRSSRKVGRVSDFTISGYLGRNLLGDFIRSNKSSSINKSIDRSQDVLLKLHSDLLMFDPKFADILDLPYKLTQFSRARTGISDMKLRVNMRKKEFDIQQAEKKLITLIKKLRKERSKEIDKIKREIELESYKN